MQLNWYVIYTKPQFEKKVAATLESKGYEVYLPLRKVIRQWSDRKKKMQEPLIKSYVFIKSKDNQREEVLKTAGIVNFLFWLGKPAIVRSVEIDAMRQFLGELDYVPEINWDFTSSGDELDIDSGVFKNQKGVFLARKGNKILLNIHSLGRIIKVEVPVQHLASTNRPS